MGVFPPVDADDFDLTPTVRAARDAFTHVVREAAYTGVGLGLLAYQRAQTRRREFEREMRRSS